MTSTVPARNLIRKEHRRRALLSLALVLYPFFYSFSGRVGGSPTKVRKVLWPRSRIEIPSSGRKSVRWRNICVCVRVRVLNGSERK